MAKQYKPFEIDINTLGYYVNRTFCVMVKMLNKELKDKNLDIQHAEFALMKLLAALDGATQNQLANLLGKERSGVSRTLSTLENKGYIRREQLNGSTNFVTLSEKGKETALMFDDIAEKVTDKALRGFTSQRKITLINNLNRIYQNALVELK